MKRTLKGSAFVVAMTVAVTLNRYRMLILLVSFISGASQLAEDVSASLIADPNVFAFINGLVFLARIAYVVAIECMLNLVPA